MMNVLLIDDRDDHNYLNSIIIEETGLFTSVNTVTSGAAALDYLRETVSGISEKPLPDLILLDINMPLMSGWDFLDGFEKLALTLHKIPKVYMLSTSNAAADKERSALYNSVRGYITKPLDEEVLSNIHFKEAC